MVLYGDGVQVSPLVFPGRMFQASQSRCAGQGSVHYEYNYMKRGNLILDHHSYSETLYIYGAGPVLPRAISAEAHSGRKRKNEEGPLHSFEENKYNYIYIKNLLVRLLA